MLVRGTYSTHTHHSHTICTYSLLKYIRPYTRCTDSKFTFTLLKLLAHTYIKISMSVSVLNTYSFPLHESEHCIIAKTLTPILKHVLTIVKMSHLLIIPASYLRSLNNAPQVRDKVSYKTELCIRVSPAWLILLGRPMVHCKSVIISC